MRKASAVLALAQTTVSQAIRDRILYGQLVFAIGLILLSGSLADLSIGWPVRIVTDLSMSAINIVGVLMAALLGVSAISKEVERRTVFTILAKPVGRAEYVFGKYLGVVATVSVNVALMMVASTVMIAQFSHVKPFQYPLADYLATLGLVLLRLAVVAAIAVAFSTFSSATVALIGTMGLAVAGHASSDLRFFLGKSDNPVLRWLGEGLYYAVPDFAALDTLPRMLHGHELAGTQLAFAGGYAVFYAATLLGLSVVVFSRRDLG